MRLSRSLKSFLLLGVAAGVAACSNADIASPGSGNPITPVIVPPGGGSGGSLAQNLVPPAGCSAGTTQVTRSNFPGSTATFAVCLLDNAALAAGPVNITQSSQYPILIENTAFVGADGGAAGNLQIGAGTVLFGNGADGVDLIVVTRGSQINASGTAGSPIVMTSAEDLIDDGRANGTAGSGQWGGVAINGRAPINDCTVDPLATPGTIACEKDGEGGSGRFGGATVADNSGRINYLRVEFSGKQFSSTNELNGMALQGVGNGTEIDFVQIYQTADDGIEWFGGSVDAKHVIISGADDDALDWTDGWNGRVQFAIVQKIAAGDNGIEADNRGSNPLLTPRSNPILSNVTLVGNTIGEGVQLRAGTDGTLANFIVTGFAEGLDYALTLGLSDPSVDSFALTANTAQLTNDAPAIFAAGSNNIQNAASTLTPRAGATLALVPGANEATPAVDPTTLDPFFSAGSYVGAVNGAGDDWYLGWTRGL